MQDELERALLDAAARGDYILGDDVARFEEEFASYVGARTCVGVNSGTAAIQLGLEALGIGPGDEVIAPASTFVASVSPAVKLGATIVLVDCDETTGLIDVDAAASAVTERTRALVAVHLYGQPANLRPLGELCDARGIALVEDACQAHGARYEGRRVGTFGRFAAFSFYPSKNLGALGDGGAVTTDDEELAARIRLLARLGEETKGVHVVAGWNERLDTLQAAALRVKLRHLDSWNERRREVAAWYTEMLAGVALPTVAPWAEHVWHLYVVRSGRRDELRAALAEREIGTGVHYPLPLHLQPALRDRLGYREAAFPGAEARARTQLSLPMYPELERAQVEQVVAAVADFAA
ncbi:MAG: DegT/DnrJ/EryC1/StrS family aminotransferase [Gaiellaceae bacterium]